MELTKESILARRKVVSVENEQDSRNWDSDIFSNLTDAFLLKDH